MIKDDSDDSDTIRHDSTQEVKARGAEALELELPFDEAMGQAMELDWAGARYPKISKEEIEWYCSVDVKNCMIQYDSVWLWRFLLGCLYYAWLRIVNILRDHL